MFVNHCFILNCQVIWLQILPLYTEAVKLFKAKIK